MFSNQVINSDAFLDMNMSAQALYFHLNMNADDDWFVSPKRIMRMLWSPDDDIKLLVMKWFVLPFADWVIVITHWKVNNNQIKLDRYTPTLYQEHLQNMTQLDKVYALELVGVQNGDKLEAKSRVEKIRLEKKRKKESEKKISPPPSEKLSLKKEIEIKQSNGEMPAELTPYLDDFINHRSEPDKRGNEKWTKEKTWDITLRLRKWKRNDDTNFGRKKVIDYTDLNNFHAMMMQERVPELKQILWVEKYFEIKKQRKDSPLYLTI